MDAPGPAASGTPAPTASGPGAPVGAAAGELALEGRVLRTLFVSDDATFAVTSFEAEAGDLLAAGLAVGERLTAVGPLASLDQEDRVHVVGSWVDSPRFGRQLRVHAAWPVLPHSAAGIEGYLGSGRVKGVGPALARRIVAHFGAQTLEIIGQSPERIAEVPGIGPKRGGELARALSGPATAREVLVFLQGLGLSAAVASRIFKRYAGATIPLVRANPYRLCEEVHGVGFATADRLARSLGFGLDDPARVGAALVHLLGRAQDDGHLCLPRATLLAQAERLLGADAPAAAVLDLLLAEQRLCAEPDDLIYTVTALALEVEAAERITGLLQREVPLVPVDLPQLQTLTGLVLAEGQAAAVRLAAVAGLLVLTGGPGTGKTTIVKTLLALFEAAGVGPILLAAPTGRAARRMAEATGHEARTLHRLLEYSPAEDAFRRDDDQPLEAAVVIVDEASMVDQSLCVALLRALPAQCRLVLVGDADQLPSVGAGNVLADLIASDRVPVARLDEIYRQASTSQIVVAAHHIRAGLRPPGAIPGAEGDFYVIDARDAEHAADLICQLLTHRIPDAFGLDPVDAVQVLTPMHRGACGAERLNARLQALLNPEKGGRAGETNGDVKAGGGAEGKARPRVGDKVMQTRNDYEREVFNGDVGRLRSIGAEGALQVAFEGRLVTVPREAGDALALAYACTVHKSQGSEYPAVVMPVVTEHWGLLQRNLLYTAVTRGRRLVVLVAQPRALERAVSNVDGLARHTALARRLGSA